MGTLAAPYQLLHLAVLVLHDCTDAECNLGFKIPKQKWCIAAIVDNLRKAITYEKNEFI
ncbi:hypothetical protein PVAP13_5KG225500 [Panicum virgatum]|uniref:Uncharacterized protein n=1 Tax=Panicum virgatum TaxID=38727 RepID=A0A8T0SK31_PANVG|nr:hypothetical protein PVAP13_5KG225500 [Panicum virgatum]